MNKLFEVLAAYSYGKTLLVGAVLAAVFYFTLYDDGSAIDAQMVAISKQVAEQEAKKKDTDATLKQVREMQEKVGRLSNQYQEISRHLPSSLSSVDVNGFVDKIARDAGVSIKIKKPLDVIRKEIVEEVPVDVTLEGNYGDLAKFVDMVSSAEKMARVRNIIISEVQALGPKRLKFEGQVVGYRLAPEKPKTEKKK